MPTDEYPDYEEVRCRCGFIPVWLLGQAIYEDIRGRVYRTNFCFRGERDGSATEEYGPPYNDHT